MIVIVKCEQAVQTNCGTTVRVQIWHVRGVSVYMERVLVRSKINDDRQPRFLFGWALGHKDADIITLMEDASVRYNGSWKYSPEGRTVANDHELQNALGRMKATKIYVEGCF